jgi:hypothetical protein
MNFYRIFLLRQGKIAAHHEFSVENDDWACRAAALAFDACADHCDDFELWCGVQLVTSRAGLSTRASGAKPAATATAAVMEEETIAALAVRILEAAMETSDALRDNPTLNSRLRALRPPPAES